MEMQAWAYTSAPSSLGKNTQLANKLQMGPSRTHPGVSKTKHLGTLSG